MYVFRRMRERKRVVRYAMEKTTSTNIHFWLQCGALANAVRLLQAKARR